MAIPNPSFDRNNFRMNEGTVIVNRQAEEPFCITIEPSENKCCEVKTRCKITLCINDGGVEFRGFFGTEKIQLSAEANRTDRHPGIEPTHTVAYWLSFNRDDRELKYGKGFVMEQTTYWTCKFDPKTNNDERWNSMFDPTKEKYFTIEEDKIPDTNEQSMEQVAKSVDFYPYPLTKNWPYLVKDSTTATMSDIASDEVLLSASLPSTCRELYAVVASPMVNLESFDPKLPAAIGHSLKRGVLSNLKDNSSGGMSEYLRITLGSGSDYGSAPRHLEIWKTGSGSAIHNHGNAYGVIKVVHGSIKITIYNKTWPENEEDPEELLHFTAHKGQVTWISPNWYQTHKLENVSEDEYCATIQCYKYSKDDHIMWPFFDYLEGRKVEEFKRGDDMDFKKMQEKVLSEYEEYLNTNDGH